MSYVIGVDIGGTFTDCVVVSGDGTLTIAKERSTPPDFEHGFVDSIRSAAAALGIDVHSLVAEAQGIYHGCTVGTNALVEGKGARVGLLTTSGHGDSIFFMQSGRRLRNLPPEAIAHVAAHEKPPPLVPKELVREVHERVCFDGSVLVEMNETLARESVAELLRAGADAFAISLLWSVANDRHERMLEAIVRELAPHAFVSVASHVVSRVGEYERTVSAVINAVVGPVMDAYLGRLETLVGELGYQAPVQVMTCTGGLITAAEARRRPVLTIGSGPVAGVIGSLGIARLDAPRARPGARAKAANAITADMGGTTLDVGVIHGGVALNRPTAWHGQYEYFAPTLDVRSIGAGGGSIIWFDAVSRTLRVGPQSAGARPGPACYGFGGTRPTTTDADLLLGYVNPSDFAGGQMRLDPEAARCALAAVGAELGFDADEAAAAAVRIVDNQMADAIRLASVQQGYDPREFTLYAYGGAGPIHGAAIAAELGIRRMVIPLSDLASGWSAFGVAGSEAVAVEETAVRLEHPFEPDELNRRWTALERRVIDRLTAQGLDRSRIALQRFVEMRYTLQVNQVQVRAPQGEYDAETMARLIEDYEREYERLFGAGTGYADAGYAITLLRVEGRSRLTDFDLALRTTEDERTAAVTETRHVTFVGRTTQAIDAPVHRRLSLEDGEVRGPAIVEYPHTSVVLPPDTLAYLDPLGNVVVELEGAA